MEIDRVDRKNEMMQIIKNDGQVINFTFNELDELFRSLYEMHYVDISIALKFNHYFPEVHFALKENRKYNTKIL